MRVVRGAQRRRFRCQAGKERGAIAVTVALFSTVAIGGAALALDLGNSWQEQRHLHVATDAAALAAAQEYALHGNGCSESVAGAYVAANDGTATMTSCAGEERSATTGFATVRAKATVTYRFAQIFGLSSNTVKSSTTAGWGIPAAAIGLRPITVCENYPDLAAWLATGATAQSSPITIPYTNANVGCSNAPGNWTLLDYDGTAGGASELAEYLRDGYPGEITVPGMLEPQTGEVASIRSALSDLVSSGITFPIPLFDVVDGQGNNARYHAVAVALVRLLDFQVNGDPSQQFFTLQFMPGIVEGTCCGAGPDTGTRTVQICAVNTDPTAGECGL